jgi:hypothetical protein
MPSKVDVQIRHNLNANHLQLHLDPKAFLAQVSRSVKLGLLSKGDRPIKPT